MIRVQLVPSLADAKCFSVFLRIGFGCLADYAGSKRSDLQEAPPWTIPGLINSPSR